LGVHQRCWNKSAVIAVDGNIVAMTTNSTSESLKCEDDVDSFFWLVGYCNNEFVPHVETVNKELYLNVLKCLSETVWRKRPEAWTNNTWVLLHDSAPTDASLICELLMKHETVVLQPPYSPGLAHVDFFLFLKLKSSLKVRWFRTVDEIEGNLIQDLCAIPQNMFQGAFKKWKKIGSSESRMDGSTLKETSLIKL
jgi:hypothetical protein